MRQLRTIYRITFATFCAIVVHMLLLAYSFGRVMQRIDDNSARLSRIEQYLDSKHQTLAPLKERVQSGNIDELEDHADGPGGGSSPAGGRLPAR